jgi:exodeoxyribonuclease VII small subunit
MAKETFETKLHNAKTILETLMDPQISLEESVKAYEKGMKELAAAQKMLEDAQLKIQKIQSK